MKNIRYNALRRIVFLLVVVTSLLQPGQSIADTRPTFCNRGDHKLNVSVVSDYWFGGERLWSEEGWWSIEARRCQLLPVIPEYRVAGYSCIAFKGDRVVYPTFSPGTSRTHDAITSGRMCANPNDSFKYAGKLAEQIGQRCKANGFSIPISFFYSTERINIGRPLEENLTLNLDWDYNSLKAFDIRKTAEGKAITTERAQEAAQLLRPKFILATFVDIAYRKKYILDSEEFYFGSPLLADNDEIDALHGILNQNLDHLGETLIGPGNRYPDKYALRLAMLPGYEIDRGLKEIGLSDVGVEVLEKLASHMGIVDDVDLMQDFFIRRVTSPDGLVDRKAVNQKSDGRPLLTPGHIKSFLSQLADEDIRLAELALRKQRKLDSEESAAARQRESELRQAKNRERSEKVRAEFAAAAEAAARAREENGKKRAVRRAQQQQRLKESQAEIQAAKERAKKRAESTSREKKIIKRTLAVTKPQGKFELAGNQFYYWRRNLGRVRGLIREAVKEERELIGEIVTQQGEVLPLKLTIRSSNSGHDFSGQIFQSGDDKGIAINGELSSNGLIITETGNQDKVCHYHLYELHKPSRLEGIRDCGASDDLWLELKSVVGE